MLEESCKLCGRDRERYTNLVQFTAGIAYPLSRACLKSLYRLSPVTTPGGTISVILAILIRRFFTFILFIKNKRRLLLLGDKETRSGHNPR